MAEVAGTLRALAGDAPPVIDWDGLPVVERHGGAISAERREAGGTCFAFTLPVREEDR